MLWMLDGGWCVGHDGMGWWMVFAGVWGAIFWVLLIGAIVWLLVRVAGGSSSEKKPSPLDIARERYARGEISREEFQRICEDLRKLS